MDPQSQLEKAATDLNYVLHFLRTEYAQKFEASGEPNLNPMKLMQRLERIQEDLPRLKEDCLTLCTEKRNLIEMSKKTLLDTRQRLLDMNKNLGLDMPDDHLDSIYQDFNEMAAVCNDQISEMIPCFSSSNS